MRCVSSPRRCGREETPTYTGKRVLITGGAGSVGSNLVRRLVALGAQVTVLDIAADRGWALPGEIFFVKGSVTDPKALDAAFADHPQLVIALAAQYGNLASLLRPETDLHVNGLGMLRTLRWAERTEGVERFIYASSGCSVYGESSQLLHEDLPPTLHYSSFYQATKLLGELYCNLFTRLGLPTVRLRFFSSFGPGEIPGRERGVVPNFIFRALRKEPLSITGTGAETRSFNFVSDLVEGIVAAGVAEDIDGEAINLAGGMERTIDELAKIVNAATGNDAGVTYTARRSWDRITTQTVSIDKARRLLGYEPKTTLEDGIARTVAWFREHWSKIEQEARF